MEAGPAPLLHIYGLEGVGKSVQAVELPVMLEAAFVEHLRVSVLDGADAFLPIDGLVSHRTHDALGFGVAILGVGLLPNFDSDLLQLDVQALHFARHLFHILLFDPPLDRSRNLLNETHFGNGVQDPEGLR